ncbi:MAG TPA: DNA mismatch repair protein MutT, partial [Bacteroidota bacterium]|nr:DNA mismatch repair protein MutT [Bacteroidota bacterium]
NPYNGVTDEICQVYLARDLRHVGAMPDETEQFELVHLSAGEVDRRIREGRIWDGMSIAAWHLARGKNLVQDGEP